MYFRFTSSKLGYDKPFLPLEILSEEKQASNLVPLKKH